MYIKPSGDLDLTNHVTDVKNGSIYRISIIDSIYCFFVNVKLEVK